MLEDTIQICIKIKILHKASIYLISILVLKLIMGILKFE